MSLGKTDKISIYTVVAKKFSLHNYVRYWVLTKTYFLLEYVVFS